MILVVRGEKQLPDQEEDSEEDADEAEQEGDEGGLGGPDGGGGGDQGLALTQPRLTSAGCVHSRPPLITDWLTLMLTKKIEKKVPMKVRVNIRQCTIKDGIKHRWQVPRLILT